MTQYIVILLASVWFLSTVFLSPRRGQGGCSIRTRVSKCVSSNCYSYSHIDFWFWSLSTVFLSPRRVQGGYSIRTRVIGLLLRANPLNFLHSAFSTASSNCFSKMIQWWYIDDPVYGHIACICLVFVTDPGTGWLQHQDKSNRAATKS